MEERTISIKYMPDRVCCDSVTQKLYESYIITISYKNSAAYEVPFSIMAHVPHKLNKEQEQQIIKEIEKLPLNMSIKKLQKNIANLVENMCEK